MTSLISPFLGSVLKFDEVLKDFKTLISTDRDSAFRDWLQVIVSFESSCQQISQAKVSIISVSGLTFHLLGNNCSKQCWTM